MNTLPWEEGLGFLRGCRAGPGLPPVVGGMVIPSSHTIYSGNFLEEGATMGGCGQLDNGPQICPCPNF